jgi:hypothetical protein
MGAMSVMRQVTRALSDGTGMTEEEVVVAVAAAVFIGSLRGALRVIDIVMDIEAP